MILGKMALLLYKICRNRQNDSHQNDTQHMENKQHENQRKYTKQKHINLNNNYQNDKHLISVVAYLLFAAKCHSAKCRDAK